ncbi:Peptide methionine sulfoxide reductase B3 [Platanthera zijinensis]|uniref:Peptide methionine sulfoxide reductase B3 n=1 Tax=Platanthera zijinensis TaxID=2320716 RepID=A0AAP0GBY3_9ASPA
MASPASNLKSEEEWRAILSPEQFQILRKKGTEGKRDALAARFRARPLRTPPAAPDRCPSARARRPTAAPPLAHDRCSSPLAHAARARPLCASRIARFNGSGVPGRALRRLLCAASSDFFRHRSSMH